MSERAVYPATSPKAMPSAVSVKIINVAFLNARVCQAMPHEHASDDVPTVLGQHRRMMNVPAPAIVSGEHCSRQIIADCSHKAHAVSIEHSANALVIYQYRPVPRSLDGM
tara:strand:- start:285 stop:614 length:330 start_codon:yes stop_codon:yes gene_type:complete